MIVCKKHIIILLFCVKSTYVVFRKDKQKNDELKKKMQHVDNTVKLKLCNLKNIEQ